MVTALFTTLLCLSSCIFDAGNFTDDEKDLLTYPVTFSIRTRTGNDVNATNDELMRSIDLYIVNNTDNKIEKIINLSFTGMTEEHKLTLKLTKGLKTVYGFANLTNSQKNAIGLSSLIEGNTLLPATMSSATCNLSNDYQIITTPGSEQYIPMSNMAGFTVTNTSGQTFNFELIRMLSKIKITFVNESGYTMAFKEYSLSPFTKSAIYALPKNNLGAPVFSGTATSEAFTKTLTSVNLINNSSIEYSMYLNETQVPDDGFFKLNVTTQKDGSVTNVYRMSLTNLNYINRNDYLPLTVILSDYKLELTARSYPPIGGYASITTTGTDEYYCRFSGGGPFIITPKLTKLSDNTEVSLTTVDFSYTDAATSIFSSIPALSYKYDKPSDPTFKSAEISGTLNSTGSGKALVNILLNITSGTGVVRTIACKVYIVLN
jgi:hypothetical protein